MTDNCANPLLLQWVSEWMQEARRRNSKGFNIYKNAYDSLKANPIQFSHPSEAKQLTGFGDKLCARLTEKMEQFCAQNGLPKPQKATKRKKHNAAASSVLTSVDDDDDADNAETPPKKQRKLKSYVPQLRSGGYGLILALATLREEPPEYITKQETIERAQEHCDTSYTVPSDPTKFYTAWKSMSALIDKQLVHERKGPVRRYALTEAGWDCAKRIQKSSNPSLRRSDSFISSKIPHAISNHVSDGAGTSPTQDCQSSGRGLSVTSTKQTPDDIIPDGKEFQSKSDLPQFNLIVLEPGSFTVELVLDHREVRTKKDRDYMQVELTKRGVKPIMRALELGDIIWVAKFHDASLLPQLGCEGDEIMLDYIVERKRLDDLISSIKDKRFHEQKFRLDRSGIKNVVYVIEEISMQPHGYSNMEDAVQSAIASLQVVNGYFVKKTQNIDDTIQYLVRMSKILKKRYERKPLHLIPSKVLTTTTYLPLLQQRRKEEPGLDYHITYPAFACLSSKSDTLNLRDIYLKMLMCTKGVTGEKAIEIQKRWKTPYELAKAYRKINDIGRGAEAKKKKLSLISHSMANLVGRKKVAKAQSANISEVWG